MAANLETPGSLERRLSMSVPVDEVERQFDERLKKLARGMKMSGFRPGKVPPQARRAAVRPAGAL